MKFEKINMELFCKLMAATKKFGEMWQGQSLSEECRVMVECLDVAFDDPNVDLVDLSAMFAELGGKAEGEFSSLCSSISKVIIDVNNSIEVVEFKPVNG